MIEKFRETEFYKRSDFQSGFAQKIQNVDDWLLIAKTFDSNYLTESPVTFATIPKKIHQIWLGSTLPKQYSSWCASWKRFHPDWEYHLWDLEQIMAFGLRNEQAFRKSPSFGVKSDIARYEILNRLGGLYVDTDFECTGSFDALCRRSSFFGGVVFDFQPEVCNALIGSSPGNPVLENLIAELQEPVMTWDSMEIIRRTGPKFLTSHIMRVLKKQPDGIVLFPSHYFYPYPNFDLGTIDPHEIPERYCHPFTLGIHYWETSWFRYSLLSRVKKTIRKLFPKKKVHNA